MAQCCSSFHSKHFPTKSFSKGTMAKYRKSKTPSPPPSHKSWASINSRSSFPSEFRIWQSKTQPLLHAPWYPKFRAQSCESLAWSMFWWKKQAENPKYAHTYFRQTHACFKYAYAYIEHTHVDPMYVRACKVLEYLYGKLFDIKSYEVNLTSTGSRPTPFYDHYKRPQRLYYLNTPNSRENSESRREFLF